MDATIPDECPVCFGGFDAANPAMHPTKCAHCLCKTCWKQIVAAGQAPWSCPLCRCDLSTWLLMEICLQGRHYKEVRNFLSNHMPNMAPHEQLELVRFGASLFRMVHNLEP
jgi:hypothetical protein